MKPQPAISGCVISEKRAAAARANSAKSRGPVTIRGRANSSRNSITQDSEPVRPYPLNAETLGSTAGQHGLRSQVLFDDAAHADFERDFAPQSGVERNLVRMMAVADWRQTCLRKLETALFNRETCRLQSLSSDQERPETDPITLLAHAFRSLCDHTCFPHTGRLESRFERQYLFAFSTLTQHRTECAANRIPEKPCSPENLNSKKVIVNERTQQAVENTNGFAVSYPFPSVLIRAKGFWRLHEHGSE
jgi:hypothetical protein